MKGNVVMININDVLQYSSTLSILYAEDDEAVRFQMLDILADFFQQVIVVKDGQEALEKCMLFKKTTDTYPDLIISDIRMPHMDGIEMSKKILELNPSQIIILNSAENESDIQMDIVHLGVKYFLVKPVELGQLYQTLYEASKERHTAKMEK